MNVYNCSHNGSSQPFCAFSCRAGPERSGGAAGCGLSPRAVPLPPHPARCPAAAGAQHGERCGVCTRAQAGAGKSLSRCLCIIVCTRVLDL